MNIVKRLRCCIGRCSWFTWLMLCLLSLALTLIIVPGEYTYMGMQEKAITPWEKRCRSLYQSTHDWHRDDNAQAKLSNHIMVTVFVHGWPKPFLARARVMKETENGPNWVRSEPMLGVKSWFYYWGGSTYLNVSWSSFDAWPLAADNTIFDAWSLVFDLLVAGFLLLTTATISQYWIASHRGQFRVHLRDLLGLVTLIALALGWYFHHHRIRVVEGLAQTPLPPGFTLRDRQMAAGQNYCGPVWLRKLCGNEYYPQPFHHVTTITITNTPLWRECCEQLPRYPYLEDIYFQKPLPLEALEYLKDCPSLKHLHLTEMSSKQPPKPDEISADNLQLLRCLNLESLELMGDQLQATHIEQVAAFPTMRFIKVTRISATAEQLDAIRADYPHVEIVIGFDFTVFLSPG